MQTSTRPNWSRISAWLPARSKRSLTQVKKELSAAGARRIQAAWQKPRVWAGPQAKPFPLVKLGRFIAVPAARQGVKLPKRAVPIFLIQAQAFGTGLHESTRLMLQGLEALAEKGALKGAQVLDVGAGSGILGFAALHLGAQSVTNVEVESAACAEMRENRGLNHVAAARFPVICGRFPLRRLKAKRYPLVLGNLVTPVLELLMPSLKRRMSPGGRLFCSGIHTPAEAARVLRAAKAQGLRPLASKSLRGWARLEFVRP